MKSIRLLAVVMMITLLFGIAPIVRAESQLSGQDGGHNNFDPNYQWTQKELDFLKAKDAAAKQHLQEKKQNTAAQPVSPMGLGSKTLYVGAAETYREPDGHDYRNYCGPSSTQVAIRARTTYVPDLGTLATEEHLNPDSGIWINNITPVINSHLGVNHYINGVANDANTLDSWLEYDIDANYALITALYTQGMPGWVVYANHIVTAYGYYHSGPNSVPGVYYVDTGSEYAGHKYGSGGAYFNNRLMSTFWVWVAADNGQVW
ncbi:MAG: hypothetical protein PHQ40_16150 [Anaerolineaceae bacterium]|nr:hypothetical protein [Anaerolineaceae bacterium]